MCRNICSQSGLGCCFQIHFFSTDSPVRTSKRRLFAAFFGSESSDMRLQGCVLTVRRLAIQLCIVLVASLSALVVRPLQGSQRSAPLKAVAEFADDARSTWKKILALRGKAPPKDAKQLEIDYYWSSVQYGAMVCFQKMTSTGNVDKKLHFFINQFGRHGADADLRWLLCDLSVTTNMLGKGGLSRSDTAMSRKHRRLQLLFARIHTLHLMKNRKILGRYCRSVIWLNIFFRHRHRFAVAVADTTKAFKKYTAKDDEYWWFARNALLLIYATGRDDLLNGTKPEDLAQRFEEWREWIEDSGNGAYLRPDIRTYRWRLDKRAKENGEAYRPFLTHFRLKPFPMLPKAPFADWKGGVPRAESLTN